jgi:probable rRNA maturation factor
MAVWQIEVVNEQAAVAVDAAQIRQAVEQVLRDADLEHAEVSVAVVGDEAIHALNRQYLRHDYPTDVLSFLLERRGAELEGEIVVSGETAARVAGELGWPAAAELLLYVIHGALHLVGHDDAEAAQRQAMRNREREYLIRWGWEPPRAELAEG